MKQYEAVIETLKRLGGCATFGQLNQEVFNIKDCTWNTKTPFASIRRIVQDRKEIFRIRPGLWALEEYRNILAARGIVAQDAANSDSEQVQEFNHSYYQGLLLYIGNMKKLATYVPAQDKNRECINVKLGEISTLDDVPPFSYQELVHRSSTIDVMWFQSNSLGSNVMMPNSFFEVEHSTDIQNSLCKFADLQSFNARMFIVADARRHDEVIARLNHDYFKPISDRVEFMSYDKLDRFYEGMMLQQKSLLNL